MPSNAPSTFDPYYKWLGIPPKDQPPNHYRLLGIELYESDQDVIDNAADARMTLLRSFQSGQHGHLTQRLLNEVSAARVCLLDPQKKATYDRELQLWRPSLNQRPASATETGCSRWAGLS